MIIKLVRHGSGKGHIIHHKRVGVLNTQNREAWYEYDQEWRMLCPIVGPNRPCIKMKPSSIALGLRMPEYERRLVISAAKVAGITSINEIIIGDNDNLTMRPIAE